MSLSIDKYMHTLGVLILTIRIITCSVVDLYKPPFATATGTGPHPIHTHIIQYRMYYPPKKRKSN